ncbi:MAG: aspartate dehydrogenase [Dorea sp.]|nr:aspartate dehydrogenase [Dorea sp.]
MKKKSFDRKNLRPVIRPSICTGEKVAGFKDIHTGKFNDVMLIRNNRDMEEFLESYDIKEGEVSTEY